MQILFVFFLAALVGCYGDESDCLERSESCVNASLGNIEITIAPKICNDLIKSIVCLNEVADSCAGDEHEDDVKLRIKHLKEQRNKACNTRKFSDDEEMQKCFEENEDFFFECVYDSMAEVYKSLAEQSDVEVTKERVTCGLYMRVGECFLKRIGEKCGHEAFMEALRVISDVPDDVNEACLSIGIALRPGPLDEDKKKK